MNLITSQLKDDILRELLSSQDVRVSIYDEELASKFSISSDKLNIILDHFEDMNLLKLTRYKGGCIALLKVNAHDYMNHGGFTAQEEILKANIEKLGLELETLSKQLEPNFLEKAEKIASISSCILGALKLFS